MGKELLRLLSSELRNDEYADYEEEDEDCQELSEPVLRRHPPLQSLAEFSSPKAVSGLARLLVDCRMFGLLGFDKRGNQRAINLLSNGWVRPQFPRQFSHPADDLFDPPRRFHLVRGLLEMRGLLDIAAPFSQQRDNLAINAVDVGAYFFEGTTVVNGLQDKAPFPIPNEPGKS